MSILDQLESAIPKGDAVIFNGVTVYIQNPTSEEIQAVTIAATLSAESQMQEHPDAEKMKSIKANRLDFREWVQANEGKLSESEKNSEPDTLYDFVKLQKYASIKNLMLLSVFITDETGNRLFKTESERLKLCKIIEKSPDFIKNLTDKLTKKDDFLAQKPEITS